MEVRKIESFREKHRKVGINQTIVVSKNGFSQSARNYSQKHNIKLLTFGFAKKENWLKNFERLKNLSVYGRNYSMRSISVEIESDSADIDFQFNNQVTVKATNGEIDLIDFARDLFVSENVSKYACKELIENESKGNDPWVEIGFNLDKKI